MPYPSPNWDYCGRATFPQVPNMAAAMPTDMAALPAPGLPFSPPIGCRPPVGGARRSPRGCVPLVALRAPAVPGPRGGRRGNRGGGGRELGVWGLSVGSELQGWCWQSCALHRGGRAKICASQAEPRGAGVHPT